MAKADLTAHRLRGLLHYDPETGLFRRLVKRAGEIMSPYAGYQNSNGHLQISVDNRLHFSHKLAWLYMHGSWPANSIDHINGVRSDNRLENLRDIPHSENMQNRRRPSRNNKTGFLGVSELKNGRFRAQISISGKTKWLGEFDTPEDAYSAYVQAKRQLHAGCTI